MRHRASFLVPTTRSAPEFCSNTTVGWRKGERRRADAVFPLASLRGFPFALPTLRSYEAKEKKEAERRQTCSANLRALRARRAPAGRARLSAFHYGSYRQGFRPLGAAPGQASWDAAGRSIRYGRSNRGAKILRSYAGVTRARLSQSRERTSRTGRSAGQHDARSCPGAECIVPRAGTALAPPSEYLRPKASFTEQELFTEYHKQRRIVKEKATTRVVARQFEPQRPKSFGHMFGLSPSARMPQNAPA